MLHDRLIKGGTASNQSVRYQPASSVKRLLFLFSLVLPLFFLFFSEQIEDSSFSLNHPNQYFLESQKILNGGKDIKRETDAPQRSQENSATRGSSGAREAVANASQGLAEMTEDLDSFFQDAWFYFFILYM